MVKVFKPFWLVVLMCIPVLAVAEKPPTPVIAYALQTQTMKQSLQLLGELKAINSVALKAKVSTNIIKIWVTDGQQVKQGDKLFSFYQAPLKAQIKEKNIAAKEAKAQYLRNKNLPKSVAASQALIDEKYRDWQLLEAQINTLKTRLNDYEVRAPFAGRIGLIDYSNGAFVEQGDHLVHLNDISTLKLDLLVPNYAANSLQVGQKISIQDQPSQQTFTGLVTAIAPELDTQTQMLKVRAQVDNPNENLKSQYLVNAELDIDSTQILTVPNQSILMVGNRNYVFKLDPVQINPAASAENAPAKRIYKVTKVAVEVGDIYANSTQIVSGIKPEDLIVSQAVLNMKEGQTVTIKALENNQSQSELLTKANN